MENSLKENLIKEVNNMSHYTMCRYWRFGAPPGKEIYFDSTGPIAKVFKERLFKHFGGFTSEISKSLSW